MLWVFPAHAGVIPVSIVIQPNSICFSRTRGGDPGGYYGGYYWRQFFPHTRGWSWENGIPVAMVNVFPAHAGVIPHAESVRDILNSFSRTRGGDPIIYRARVCLHMFFPHTRGWSRLDAAGTSFLPVFPAHAGVILYLYQWPPTHKRFSRTRGGDPDTTRASLSAPRFFPHTRGWSRNPSLDMGTVLVFPAHAGVIPVLSANRSDSSGFSRTRGGDPGRISMFSAGHEVFPAHAGVIPPRPEGWVVSWSFSRTRGGDPLLDW